MRGHQTRERGTSQLNCSRPRRRQGIRSSLRSFRRRHPATGKVTRGLPGSGEEQFVGLGISVATIALAWPFDMPAVPVLLLPSWRWHRLCSSRSWSRRANGRLSGQASTIYLGEKPLAQSLLMRTVIPPMQAPSPFSLQLCPLLPLIGAVLVSLGVYAQVLQHSCQCALEPLEVGHPVVEVWHTAGARTCSRHFIAVPVSAEPIVSLLKILEQERFRKLALFQHFQRN